MAAAWAAASARCGRASSAIACMDIGVKHAKMCRQVAAQELSISGSSSRRSETEWRRARPHLDATSLEGGGHGKGAEWVPFQVVAGCSAVEARLRAPDVPKMSETVFE